MSMGFLVDPDAGRHLARPEGRTGRRLVPRAGAVGATSTSSIIDLPPGTGDAQLTLSQQAPLTGAIVVTTPGEVSLIDARKAVKMFEEVRVPVLGVIENMSHFTSGDGQRSTPSSAAAAARSSPAEAGVPFLGELPIDPRVATAGDAGEPVVRKQPRVAGVGGLRQARANG